MNSPGASPEQVLASAVEALRADRRSGASALARELAAALDRWARETPASGRQEFLAGLRVAARRLANARPSMLALAQVAGLLVESAADAPAGEDMDVLRCRVGEAARQVSEGWEAASERIAAHARRLLPATVLTHSYSASVVAALRARPDGRPSGRRPDRAVVCEGRPLFEGRSTARELAAAGIDVTLVTDAQGPLFLSRVEAVLVGADGVLADGSVINKVGTYPLALAARDRGLPFYAACESLKISPRLEWTEADMEEGDPAEVLPDGMEGVTPRNLYFERTPARLVTALITDEGVFRPHKLGPLLERARRWQQALTDNGCQTD
jgi:translation initiation factor 2B subunit (eIF-2B alpha/beta/delta family)